jgi:hypothetical protein
MRMNVSMGTAVLVATGAVATWALMRRSSRNASSMPAMQTVRNAGPEEMALPPRNWDIVDETVDESFPASDPPGTY